MNSKHQPASDTVPSEQPLQSTNVHVPTPKFFMPVFLTLIVATLIYIGVQVSADLSHVPALSVYSIILLSTALFIALGFEFVNGFHDTANAVATVIYTNALPAPVAVMWAGFCNFLGVMVASGAVAYGIIALLPVELIMNVGSGAGFSMVFAMLISAIMWNLGTWVLGIPASSSHTLIGSILGVGIMNYLLHSSSGATLARHQGQQVSINIAPSTTTRSVVKNPLLKAAFNGASLFDVEAFEPETTNAIMAALWIHDLCHSEALANPKNTLDHPLELMMDGANHGGLWHVGYLARTALPFAALYGFATDKLSLKKASQKTAK